MYKIALLTAVALVIATPAVAKCKAPVKNATVAIDYYEDNKMLYLVDLKNGQYAVYDQNPKTCKTFKTKMTEDQLYTKYGVADELETGSIDAD